MPCIKDMLFLISETGLSQQEIASIVGVSQPTIHRAMTCGAAVKYETGKKIELLYSERVLVDKAA
jgi:predicted XRE-type DNA-binding protein